MAGVDRPPAAVLASTWETGAGILGAGDGPAAILARLRLSGARLPTPVWHRPRGDGLSAFVDHAEALCRAVAQADGPLLLLSGDHGNAAGWISGLADAWPGARVGVVWVDAHGDLHSPLTSPSMNLHGMPLGALLDADNAEHARRQISTHTWMNWQRLKRLGQHRLCPKLRPEDVVLVDARDLEPEEWQSATDQGMRVFTPHDRRRLGVAGLLSAIEHHLRGCDLIYVSFDVDAVDGALAPGTGCPVGDGMRWSEAQALVAGLMRLPATCALEVAELNPHLDRGDATLAGTCGVLRQAWPGIWAPTRTPVAGLVA